MCPIIAFYPSNIDAVTGSPLSILPSETWIHIFSHLDYQHPTTAQPSWEPWLVYRSVNRHFKALVEGEYVRRYLRKCAVVLDAQVDDGGCARFDSTGATIEGSRDLRYEFAGFSNELDAAGRSGEGDRFAVLRCKLDDTLETSSIAHTQGLDRPPQYNYHPKILMHLGTGATDLLPSDLQFISSSNDPANSWTFTFDWRIYFCTLFNEIKHAAAYRDECWQKKLKNDLFFADDEKEDLDRGRGQSLVALATSLYQQAQKKNEVSQNIPVFTANSGSSQGAGNSTNHAARRPPSTMTHPNTANSSSPRAVNVNTNFSESDDDEDLLSVHARAQLMLAAGTYEIGADGRYREVRRQRRRRLWHRLQQDSPATELRLLKIEEAHECETEEHRRQRMAFERHGEGRVARKLLMLQAEMAGKGRAVEW